METTPNQSDFISLVEDLGSKYCQESYWATKLSSRNSISMCGNGSVNELDDELGIN